MTITPSLLLAANWRSYGNAWYNGTRTITNWDNRWQLWEAGVNRIIVSMEDISKTEIE